MVDGFSTLLTQTTSINHNDMLLKLSKVRISPKVDVQAKKATLNGALLYQMHLQGKWVLSRGIKTL
jgi:hypothetical protein